MVVKMHAHMVHMHGFAIKLTYKYCMLLTEFLHKSYTNLDVILNAIKDKSSLLKKAIFISSDLILIPTNDYSKQDMLEFNNLLQRNL